MPRGVVVTEGLQEQIAAMRGADAVLGEEFQAAMAVAVQVGAGGVKEISPIDKGRLRASITGEVVSAIGMNVVGVVGTNVTAFGFPYPKALNESDRYHYRAGPRRGQPTKEFFERGMAAKQHGIETLFEQAAARALERLAED